MVEDNAERFDAPSDPEHKEKFCIENLRFKILENLCFKILENLHFKILEINLSKGKMSNVGFKK